MKDTYTDLFPLYENTETLSSDVLTMILNKAWRPSLSILGITNYPTTPTSENLIQNSIQCKIAIRLPPLLSSETAANKIKEMFTQDFSPFGSLITVSDIDYNDGWSLKNYGKITENIMNNASLMFFGNKVAFLNDGGSIPFVNYFQDLYPNTDILCTGVNELDCNEHGPNESILLDAAKKFMGCLVYLMSEY